MTSSEDRWLLPDGVEEVLPAETWQLESLRRRLLDLLWTRGFDLVMPPAMEYLESLLTGVGEDLDLQTYKIIDQTTGRLMGIRADHTPQVARIDAHYLRLERPVRLCYIGPVLRTRPEVAGGAREVLQVGAELFGSGEVRADCEIIETMLALLRASGIERLHLDLGHVGIYRTLAAWARLPHACEMDLFEAIRRRSRPDVERVLREAKSVVRAAFSALMDLRGGPQILDQASQTLGGMCDAVEPSLEQMRAVAESLTRHHADVSLHVDLAELRGYRYHTGVVFAAYAPGHGRSVAQGGRYDDIGASFGRSRSATGFSADLRQLARFGDGARRAPRAGIVAPYTEDEALRREVESLRRQGERVVSLLPRQPLDPMRTECDRVLVQRDGRWQVEQLLEDE